MAFCKFCGKEVTWMREGKKSVPVEGDGGIHACENFTNARKSLREVEKSEIDPELLKQYENAINKKKK
ncbi:MAG: hypothetical protein ACI9QD_000509 [Thermoproteota archaeon]|jgi:hypothetical protein